MWLPLLDSVYARNFGIIFETFFVNFCHLLSLNIWYVIIITFFLHLLHNVSLSSATILTQYVSYTMNSIYCKILGYMMIIVMIIIIILHGYYTLHVIMPHIYFTYFVDTIIVRSTSPTSSHYVSSPSLIHSFTMLLFTCHLNHKKKMISTP